ncbi:hypothetical protein GOBAR_DD05799 [Gossypium barbadense]|nr:hypothetical protein GOBAR_DD05799 [Gossypium barbadense]
MLFFSSGDGVTADFVKWILFGRASTGTGGGGFWSSNSLVSTSKLQILIPYLNPRSESSRINSINIMFLSLLIRVRFQSICFFVSPKVLNLIIIRGSLKSPWSHRRRKHALLPKQWRNLFTADGKLIDGGVKFLKKIRSGGVDPGIRAEVWPFLLGIYDFNSSKEERDSLRSQKRKEYERLRKRCHQILKRTEKSVKLKGTAGNVCNEDNECFSQFFDSPGLEDMLVGRRSHLAPRRSALWFEI